MKQEEVFRKIGGIIKELNDQYEYLKTVKGGLNDLELELFVSNAHFLSDHIEILRKLNLQSTSQQHTAKPQEAAERKYFEPVVQQVRHEGTEEPASPIKPVEIEITNFRPDTDNPVTEIDPSTDISEEIISPVKEEPETIRHELILDDSEIWDDDEYHETVVLDDLGDEETDAPVPQAAPINPVKEQPSEEIIIKHAEKVISEKIVTDVLTINQKMSSQLGDKAVGRTEQLTGSPISDIKQAVTLNDKLLFVKDLFNGYSLAYSEAVEILNRFTSFEEATRFLNTNYVTKNNWESKPATAEKFYALLKRRYAGI